MSEKLEERTDMMQVSWQLVGYKGEDRHEANMRPCSIIDRFRESLLSMLGFQKS